MCYSWMIVGILGCGLVYADESLSFKKEIYKHLVKERDYCHEKFEEVDEKWRLTPDELIAMHSLNGVYVAIEDALSLLEKYDDTLERTRSRERQ